MGQSKSARNRRTHNPNTRNQHPPKPPRHIPKNSDGGHKKGMPIQTAVAAAASIQPPVRASSKEKDCEPTILAIRSAAIQHRGILTEPLTSEREKKASVKLDTFVRLSINYLNRFQINIFGNPFYNCEDPSIRKDYFELFDFIFDRMTYPYRLTREEICHKLPLVKPNQMLISPEAYFASSSMQTIKNYLYPDSDTECIGFSQQQLREIVDKHIYAAFCEKYNLKPSEPTTEISSSTETSSPLETGIPSSDQSSSESEAPRSRSRSISTISSDDDPSTDGSIDTVVKVPELSINPASHSTSLFHRQPKEPLGLTDELIEQMFNCFNEEPYDSESDGDEEPEPTLISKGT